MARLSKTQQERATRLKALMTHVPEGTDISKLIFDFLRPISMTGGLRMPHPAGDRHAAIACAAAIEHGLKGSITLHLASDASSKALFDDFEGPLGSFSARVIMARALGIIDAATAADLDVIRRIRNTFAHSVLPITFGENDLAHLVTEIKRLKDPIWDVFDQQYTDARDRYVMSCAVHYAALLAHKGPPRLNATARALALAEAILASPRTPPLPPLLPNAFGDHTNAFGPPPLKPSPE